jgi:calcium-dependent protein kinase
LRFEGRGISKYAKHFVDKCFKKDPNERWTAKEALDFLESSWIPAMHEAHKDDSHNSAEEALNRTIVGQRQRDESIDINMEDIQRFCTYGRLKKTILLTMAQTMDRNDIGQLKEIFLRADTEDTGTLNLAELRNAVVKLEPDLSEKEIEDLFKGIDQDESGEIHYMEFLAALAESQGLVTLERLSEAFDRIDTEGKGYISHDDLKMVLGKDYDKGAVDRMIKEADFKNNGQVDYEELLKLMFEDPSKGMDTVGNVTESLRSLEGFQDLTRKFRVMTTTEE